MLGTLALVDMVNPDRPSATQVVSLIFDPGSFRQWHFAGTATDDPQYAEALERALVASGEREAVIAGEGLVEGRRVVLVAGEFAFLAGSVGRAAADIVVAAVSRATALGLPLIAAPTSGGTRMQEGTPAFVRMVPIAAAVAAHRETGLPAIVWLRHPTTGGVMATWGSLGQVTGAAPGALAGFLGPRVYELLAGKPFPAGVQTAENLVRVGVIDAVVAPADLRDWLVRLLAAMTAQRGDVEPLLESAQVPGLVDGWECVQATRQADRPGVREVLAAAAEGLVVLSGTGEGERDDAVLLALARIGGVGVVVVAQDRASQRPLGPAGLRTARRGYRLAAELGLVLVTVVDTEGAETSAHAEEGAMAGEIARSLAELARLRTPVVAMLLGSGCGGGALSMLPGDVILAAQDSWVTPLPPEGASAILYRTTDRAADIARSGHITAADLAAEGIVDWVFPAGEDLVVGAAQALVAAVRTAVPGPHRIGRFGGRS